MQSPSARTTFSASTSPGPRFAGAASASDGGGILSRLKRVKKTGPNSWTALCPAHADQNPSLSIRVASDGKILLCCHAGCKTESIVTAAGLTMGDLFPAESKPQRRRIAATYDYAEADGKLLFQAVRYEPKDFRQRRPDGNGGWVWNLQGVTPVLYRVRDWADADTVCVVEGEKDADALLALGIPATTCAMGAGKWREAYNDTLKGKCVVILPDNDTPGQAHAAKVARSVKSCAESVKILELPGLPEGGDVSDFISRDEQPGLTLRELVDSAPLYEPPEHEAADRGLMCELVDVATYAMTEPPEPDAILSGVFDRGDKVALLSKSKMRKTFFASQLALSLAAGQDFLGLPVPKRRTVLFLNSEIKATHFHRRTRRMLEAMGLCADDVAGQLWIANTRGAAVGIDWVERSALAVNADVVVFDPLYKWTSGDENSVADVKPTLAAFDCLAESTGAAVLYVHHDCKGAAGDKDVRDRGAGSSVLSRDYDAAIVLTEHRDDPDAAVVGFLLRNYAPLPSMTALWEQGCFQAADNLPAIARTSANRSQYADKVAELATQGLSDAQIAEQLGCDRSTAYRLRKRIQGYATD